MSSRTYHRQKQSRARSRKRAVRKQQQSTVGLWFLLVIALLVTVIWVWWHISPDLLRIVEITGIALLLALLLLIIVWFVLRARLTPDERTWRKRQQEELDQANETARAIGMREIELDDLRYLSDKEFEQLTAALVETMGVASEIEVVGGSGDGGIDLRGKNRFRQLFVAQCKRYFGHPVTPKETREFGGTMNGKGAGEGWFVTTSIFTAQAKKDVRKWTSPGLMVLVDGPLLISSIRDHWHALPDHCQWQLTACMAENDRQR